MEFYLTSFSRSSRIRQKFLNAIFLHILEEQTPKKIKKFVAQK
jgi:hypothetical protein